MIVNSSFGIDFTIPPVPPVAPPNYVQLNPAAADAAPPVAPAKKPFSKTWPFIAAAVVAAFWFAKR